MLQPLTKSQALSAMGEMPAAVTINGIPYWQAQNGRTFPQVAGAEDPPPADSQTEEDDSPGDAFDKDRALATIRKLRDKEKADSAALKIAKAALAAAEAKDRERDDAEKSELEKAQKRLATLEQSHKDAEAKLRRVLVAQAIERAATKHNARDPEVIAKLIDLDALTLDDQGAPTNADELVKSLLKEKQYLVNSEQPTTNGNSGVPPTPRSSGAPGHADKQKIAEAKLVESGDYRL